MAFSGYLYNSANIQPFSGHLGLPELRCPDLDAIGTPFEYFNASQSPVFGAAIPMGPWDAAAARSKLWVIEDDQRTPFGSQGAGPFGYCLTAAEYAAKARLNLLVTGTGIYGVGSYLMDQRGLFHADLNDTNATAAVWRAIAQARDDLIELQARPAAPAVAATASQTGKAGWTLTPQVVLFTDSTSALFWRLATGEHHSLEDHAKGACPPGHWPCSDPLSWNQNVLIDPVLALGTLGAPLRQYQLTDLLLDGGHPAASRSSRSRTDAYRSRACGSPSSRTPTFSRMRSGPPSPRSLPGTTSRWPLAMPPGCSTRMGTSSPAVSALPPGSADRSSAGTAACCSTCRWTSGSSQGGTGLATSTPSPTPWTRGST